MASNLQRLCAWYRSRCDGEWEHHRGVQIGTLDNPGWTIEIDLEGTPLESVPFSDLDDRYEHATQWLRCWREGRTFHAACGPERLEEALQVFLDWAEEAGRA